MENENSFKEKEDFNMNTQNITKVYRLSMLTI